jgi:hypothetical protein
MLFRESMEDWKGENTVLMKRDEGGAFDDLAMGLDSGAISRGRALKLAGAALVASALGLSFASDAYAGPRERCIERHGRNAFCRSGEGDKVCCKRDLRPIACCGKFGAQCCRQGQSCVKGKCVG